MCSLKSCSSDDAGVDRLALQFHKPMGPLLADRDDLILVGMLSRDGFKAAHQLACQMQGLDAPLLRTMTIFRRTDR